MRYTVRAMNAGDTAPLPALHAAAKLDFDLIDAEGNDVSCTSSICSNRQMRIASSSSLG